MFRRFAPVLIGLLAGSPAQGCDGTATLTTEELGAPVLVTVAPALRGSPHRYFDQALASLERHRDDLHWECKRRVGRVAGMYYSMYCYTVAEKPGLVRVEGQAVKNRVAWTFQAQLDRERFVNQLLALIDVISNFPTRVPSDNP